MAKFKAKAVAPSEHGGAGAPAKEKKQVQRLRSNIDWLFAGILLALLTMGTVFIYSASYVFAKEYHDSSYHPFQRRATHSCQFTGGVQDHPLGRAVLDGPLPRRSPPVWHEDALQEQAWP